MMSRITTMRVVRVACLALTVGLAAAVSPSPSSAQVTPEEHEKHHPGQGQKKNDGQKTEGGSGGMGGMECGMEGMGKTPPKELYPSLMNLPDLTPERREEIRRQARERMNEGIQIGITQLVFGRTAAARGGRA